MTHELRKGDRVTYMITGRAGTVVRRERFFAEIDWDDYPGELSTHMVDNLRIVREPKPDPTNYLEYYDAITAVE